MSEPFSQKILRNTSKGDNYYLLIRDTLMTTLIAGIAAILNFSFNLKSANSLASSDYANFATLLGLIYLVQIPALSFESYFAKKVAENDYFKDLNNLFRLLSKIVFYLVIASFFLILLAPLISSTLDLEIGLIYVLIIVIFGSLLTPFLRGYLLGVQRIGAYNLLILMDALLKFIFLLFALRISVSEIGPLLAYGIPSFVVASVALVMLIKGMHHSAVSTEKVDFDKRFLFNTLLTIFLFNAFFSIDILLVSNEYKAEYGVLSLFGKIVFFASSLASMVFYSYLVNNNESKSRKLYLFIAVIFNSALSLSVVYVIALFGDLIFGMMFGVKYPEVVNYLTPFAVATAFYSLAYTFILYMISQKWHVQVYVLLILLILQIFLFSKWNDELADAVINQVVVYSTLAISIAITWYVFDRKSNKLLLDK